MPRTCSKRIRCAYNTLTLHITTCGVPAMPVDALSRARRCVRLPPHDAPIGLHSTKTVHMGLHYRLRLQSSLRWSWSMSLPSVALWRQLQQPKLASSSAVGQLWWPTSLSLEHGRPCRRRCRSDTPAKWCTHLTCSAQAHGGQSCMVAQVCGLHLMLVLCLVLLKPGYPWCRECQDRACVGDAICERVSLGAQNGKHSHLRLTTCNRGAVAQDVDVCSKSQDQQTGQASASSLNDTASLHGAATNTSGINAGLAPIEQPADDVFRMQLVGAHQADNVAAVLAAIQTLQQQHAHLQLPADSVKQAMESVSLPGKAETHVLRGACATVCASTSAGLEELQWHALLNA